MYKNLLFNQFKQLVRGSAESEHFNVISLPELDHKLGVSNEGFPKFFVCTNSSISSTPNIVREILSVEYNLPCTLVEDNNEQNEDFYTIITLRNLDEPLQAYFIDIFVMMLKKLPPIPSKRELSIEIESLITIFSALTKTPIKEVQGLWAELLVIEQSLHPETLIQAWHDEPSTKYDFTMGRDKIEVKSTSSEERIHRFSLDQLNPTPNSQLLIASVIVRDSAKCSGGLSVRNLYDKICSRVTALNARLKLSSIMAKTIGNDYKKIDNVFFDYVGACDTLAYFDYNDVPRIRKSEVPEFVFDVKFHSNLSHLTDIKNTKSVFDRSTSSLYKSLF